VSDDSPRSAPRLDRTIHEPARLGILALLYVVEAADFTFVQQSTGLTAGNLSAHVSKLEAEGHVEVDKAFSERRPLTTLRLTPQGRRAFVAYAREMRRFLDRVVPAEATGARRGAWRGTRSGANGSR
jgi:DNA-binding MarR family transcriptional regulator